MEEIFIITVLCIFFLPHSASSLEVLPLQPSLQNQGKSPVDSQQLSLPPLPRKLRFTEHQVKEYEARDLPSHKKKKESLSGHQQQQKKQKMVVGRKGTRQEWMEGDDPSQYFTMDYSGVRRRQPIHNKHLPVSP